MADFRPDCSFVRRRRGGGDRRTLAAALAESGPEGAPAPAAPEVFTRTNADDAAPAAAPPPNPAPPPPEADPQPREPAPAPSTPLSLADDELAALLAGAATEARAAAEASTAQLLARAETALADALAQDLAARERDRDDDAELIGALVRTIAAHVIPRAIAAAPLDDLLAELPALLSRLQGPERVTVVVHPDLVEPLETRLAAVAASAGFGGTITAEGDAELAHGDAVVRWPAGEASRRVEARIEEASRHCAGWLAERSRSAPGDTPATPDDHGATR
jgi:flagellar biosynthesis/type III secretory pathway protein FliH